MHRQISEGVGYYTFDSFSDFPQLIHGISTRHGGTSPAPFDTLNLSLSAGDTAANVKANNQTWHRALGLDAARTVTAQQIRANRVARVGEAQSGGVVPGVDALLTNKPGVALMLRFADCVPVLIYDPKRRAIACVHSGWEGTIKKIVSEAVMAMVDAFASRPSDIVAAVGPSIGPCCYTVREDVAAQVRGAFPDRDDLLTEMPDGIILFDLWEANALQLRACGVERIEIAGLCTCHRIDDFFSWRAEKARTGRFASTIALGD